MSDDSTPDQPDFAAGIISDGTYTLLIADFADTSVAWEAYEALKSVEDGRHVEIEGVIVVKRDADGTIEVQKSTDHTTRRGLKWGIVGGVALGVLFPPSILGSAAALGAAGAAAGKVKAMHNRSELSTELETVIAPGHSGIIALVSDPAAVELQKALDRADAIVSSAVDDIMAKDIREAAKEADEADKADKE